MGTNSAINLGLPASPLATDPTLHGELIPVYNAIRILQQVLDDVGISISGGVYDLFPGLEDTATTVALKLIGGAANYITITNDANDPTVGTSAGALNVATTLRATESSTPVSGAGVEVYYGTTAASRITFNPLNKSAHITLSNGNLTGTSDGTADYLNYCATPFKSTGKRYCEIVFSASNGANTRAVGINKAGDPISDGSFITSSGDGKGYAASSGISYKASAGGGLAAYGDGIGFVNGDVISILWDADVGTLIFWKNGVSQGTAFTGVIGSYRILVSGYQEIGATLNSGASAFSYTPAPGYSAWGDNDIGFVIAYDRTSAAYNKLILAGLTLDLMTGSENTALSLSGSGAHYITIANDANDPTVGTSAGVLKFSSGMQITGGGTAPNAGVGVEIGYSAGAGSVVAFDRSGVVQKPLGFSGSVVTVYTGATPSSLLTALQMVNSGGADVNFVSLSSSTTGNGPILTASGSDANVTLHVRSKGTGNVVIGSGGNPIAQFTGGSAANYITIANNANDPTLGTASAGVIKLSSGFQVTGSNTATAGTGVEIAYITGSGYINAYDRTGAAWKDLAVGGLTLTLAGTTAITLNTPFINLNSSGYIQWGTPRVNPGGGAGATLNTIGGTGPATALQNAWVPIKDSAGGVYWFPVWQ